MPRMKGKTGIVQFGAVVVARLTQWTVVWATDEIEATEMGMDDKDFEGGLRDCTVTMAGNWDATDAGQEDVYEALDGTKSPVAIYPSGSTVPGEPVVEGASMLVSNFEINSEVAGLVTFKCTARGGMTKGLAT